MNSGLLIGIVSAVSGVILVALTVWLIWLQVIDHRRIARSIPAGNGSAAGPGEAVRTSGHSDRPLRVMLVDDHEFVRESISRLLRERGIVVAAEAASVAAAIDAADRVRPDVIVMDVQLPDGSGIEATREIRDRNPDIRVLMLTASEDDVALISSIMAGASGYVRKRVSSDDLVTAVRSVGAGRNLIDPDLIGALLERLRSGADTAASPDGPAQANGPAGGGRPGRLSAQESSVLSLIAQGLTNRRITAELGLTDRTLHGYVSSILGKLGITRRSQVS